MRQTEVRIRELTVDELESAWELGRLAFGSSTTTPPAWVLEPVPGMTRYGAFDADGRLIGKASDLHNEQWWSGRPVVAADVGGVAVLPEARGRGVARALLGELLRGARERGAAISALYPTVAAPYRRSGWEICGALRTVDLPSAALPRHRPAPSLTVRPGGPADLPAVTELYERVGRHRCGLLTRRGALFNHLRPSTALPPRIDGLTLVEQDGKLTGCAGWQRGTGYGLEAVLTVPDLLAETEAAARELVGVLSSWQSVTPTVRLTLLAHDAVTAQLPMERARQYEQRMWMHRPVDVVRAVETRGWPEQVRGTVDFALTDDVAPWNSGFWRLVVADGAAELRRIPDEPALRLSVRGFALLYTGAARARAVAEAGLLQVTAGASPDALDLLGSGPRAELLDYF